MKKVLLTKSQEVRHLLAPTGGELSKSLPITVPGPSAISQPIRVIAIGSAAPPSSAVYMQRKSFKSVFEDIFKLLMRIPDKALQQRVIDAINGHNIGDKAPAAGTAKHCSCGAQKVHSSTQTVTQTQTQTLGQATQSEPVPSTSIKSEEKPAIKHEASSPLLPAAEPSEPVPPVKVPKKRGRKRNTCVPQVVKRSAAEMALQEREEKQLTPVVTKKKKLEVTVSKRNRPQNRLVKAPDRRDSNLSDISFDMEELTRVDNYIERGDSTEQLVTLMANVFKNANTMSVEGLLPIHDDILRNDVYGVKRQIFAILHGKWNINTMLSAEGEDCLQLALMNDIEPEIVKDILSIGCLTDIVYENSNNVLHLAVINNINLESIRVLLRRIDLNLLLEPNDDGYTALHLAVRHNQFYVAETILDCIDEQELGEPVYKRSAETPNTDGRDDKAFARFYDRACDRLETSKDKLKNRRLKLEVVNAAETRAGNSPLFYAVEGELEHFCYFLLAHLADPDQENFIGHSPKSYHYEYARLLRINLKVSRIMDKVMVLLNS
ncbi:hypothetical protein KR018_000537 [Drosophila ironensis]|nr:hypothetical protein KR018_000537 [Drosophila ironensis]